ncbi:major facilitator superfamily MFS_1 [Sulfolobus islandicus Y.N.15.51]|uniref:Major facilitator superfamily MFS_1 n=1 Tax=Saccharolobus islandicus (strain Y.N.15.51 / Yellowstone \|nr:OFA family MFS transporter [Sulfolobus islandicus]ACP48847.1 major facilitator superfamily MFS_1 [Sulfolobus islandicus Y.N.15.51]
MKRNKYIIIGFVIMCFNSLYQYSWNALEPLLREGFNVSVVEIALGFTLFSVFSSVFQPIGGHFADKQGPKRIGVISAILSAIGFLGTYLSPNICVFFVSWSIGSIGEGILYGIAANLAMKWFRERMGFATGIVSMGFGIGSAIANPFISMAGNYRIVTLAIGLVEIVLLPILLYISDYPPKLSGQTPRQAVLSVKFWLIYLSFATSIVPLTVLSSELPILGKGLPQQELVTLISILPLLSGGLRPIFGYIADRLGILRTTFLLTIVLTLGSISLLLGEIALSTILVGFAGGSLITLYFNVSTEIFGFKFSTVNSGILYTGKALGGVLGSIIFALLYTISLRTSEIYTLSCSLIGVLTLLPLLFTKQSRKVQ